MSTTEEEHYLSRIDPTVGSKLCIGSKEFSKMTRRAETSSQARKSPVQEDLPKIEVFVPSLVLCESNYRQLVYEGGVSS